MINPLLVVIMVYLVLGYTYISYKLYCITKIIDQALKGQKGLLDNQKVIADIISQLTGKGRAPLTPSVVLGEDEKGGFSKPSALNVDAYGRYKAYSPKSDPARIAEGLEERQF